MELSYIAQTERCALLLDGGGVCRWIVPKVEADDEIVTAARRCIGAQYVACLDRSAPGLLSSEPRVGTSLLFAIVKHGRVSLVRFGPLQAFEKLTMQELRSDDTDVDVASSVTPTASAQLAPRLELDLDELEEELELDLDFENEADTKVQRPSGIMMRAKAVMDPFDDDVTAPAARAASDIAAIEEIAATYARIGRR